MNDDFPRFLVFGRYNIIAIRIYTPFSFPSVPDIAGTARDIHELTGVFGKALWLVVAATDIFLDFH